MKKYAIPIILLFVAACASTPRNDYRTIGAVKIAVDTGMRAWADRVIDGKATPDQEARVRAAFDTYKHAALAYLDSKIHDTDAVPLDVANAATALLELLRTFGVNTTGGK